MDGKRNESCVRKCPSFVRIQKNETHCCRVRKTGTKPNAFSLKGCCNKMEETKELALVTRTVVSIILYI